MSAPLPVARWSAGPIRGIAILAVLGTVAATASAAGTVKDPKALALRTTDFPAGAVAGPSYTVPNGTFGAKDYSVTFNFHAGSREEEVTTEVATSRSSSEAKTAYARMVATYASANGISALSTPGYGDEQRAVFLTSSQRAFALVIARRNAVVWRLEIESCGPLAPAGCLSGRTPRKLSKAQALAELENYAAKQKARVGAG